MERATSTPWIHMPSSASGPGTAAFTFTADANTTSLPRTGNVAIAGKTVTFNQTAQTPAPSPTPSPTPGPAPSPTPSPAPGGGLVLGSTIELPTQCQASILLSIGLGLSTATCNSVQGTIQNTGTACAAGVRGTLTALNGSGQQVGFSQWVYLFTMRPGETAVYTAGPITLSVAGGSFRQTIAWNNVGC
jgi:all-beta uncharacterized protein